MKLLFLGDHKENFLLVLLSGPVHPFSTTGDTQLISKYKKGIRF